MSRSSICFFFFFQAEDGIRDLTVTGVQTCALPISTDGVHVLFSGTSMATPMVTGSIALLLERRSDLTPEQVRAVLTGTARPDGFTATSYETGSGVPSGSPNASWGAGKLDVQAALAQVTAALTVVPGTTSPTGQRVRIGANAALQFVVTAGAGGGGRVATNKGDRGQKHCAGD